jgi:hypothetical protein
MNVAIKSGRFPEPRRGGDKSAQGNALGIDTPENEIALKGRNMEPVFRPFRAFCDRGDATQGVALG